MAIVRHMLCSLLVFCASDMQAASAVTRGSVDFSADAGAGQAGEKRDAVRIAVVDQNGGPVLGAVLYIPARGDAAVADSGAAAPSPPQDIVIDQLGERFVPYVAAARVGDVIRFRNSDPVSHHIYSFSQALRLNLVVPREGQSAPFVMPDAGIIALGCNIHDHMAAFIVVADSDAIAVTGPDGHAVLPASGTLPRRIEIWHPRLKGGQILNVAVPVPETPSTPDTPIPVQISVYRDHSPAQMRRTDEQVYE